MGDGGCLDARGPDVPLALRAGAEGDPGRELVQMERRERRGEVVGEALGQRLGGGRAPDDDLGVRHEQRREEHQPLDVVEVQVGEQDVDAACSTGEPEPEIADARAGVEHEEPPVRERDLEAGGVAAVAIRRGARGGHRAACAPHFDPHGVASTARHRRRTRLWVGRWVVIGALRLFMAQMAGGCDGASGWRPHRRAGVAATRVS